MLAANSMFATVYSCPHQRAVPGGTLASTSISEWYICWGVPEKHLQSCAKDLRAAADAPATQQILGVMLQQCCSCLPARDAPAAISVLDLEGTAALQLLTCRNRQQKGRPLRTAQPPHCQSGCRGSRCGPRCGFSMHMHQAQVSPRSQLEAGRQRAPLHHSLGRFQRHHRHIIKLHAVPVMQGVCAAGNAIVCTAIDWDAWHKLSQLSVAASMVPAW